jgi:hypothetical protein
MMEENKDVFRKVESRNEFFLSKYQQGEYGVYLYSGYYEKVSFTNGTHLWYLRDSEDKLKNISNEQQIKMLDNLYFKAVDESSF